MKVSYFHVGDDVPNNLNPNIAVVIDVLRATTTISCALDNGAKSIHVFEKISDLLQEASKFKGSEKILIGERGGQKLDGFDLGNSPLGVSEEKVKNKHIFMSTTNGTKALKTVSEAKNLYTMSLANREAIANEIIGSSTGNELWIVGSGWEGSYALEDSLAAGALIDFLLQKGRKNFDLDNDEAYSALSLWKYWNNNIEKCLRVASHGQRLAGLSNHDDDFKCCSKLDNLSVVPTQVQKGILQAK